MPHISIRQARLQDASAIAAIEAVCFRAAEAAGLKTIQERIAVFPANFFVAHAGGEIIGFINGCVTDSPTISDDLFENTGRHLACGPHQAVFGLDVLPAYRRQGIAARLLRHFIDAAQNAGRHTIILTCKQQLVPYYERFGFVNNGVSQSVHGGAVWYDMTLPLTV